MQDESRDFLFRMLESASPSGFETEAARLWRAEAETFADEVEVDTNGNSYARLKGDGAQVMIEGHIDEIGVMVTHIDDDGYLWISGIGGWDDRCLSGSGFECLEPVGQLSVLSGKSQSIRWNPKTAPKSPK